MPWGLFIWCEGMAQYSSELSELTVSVFENRIGRDISKEEARQAVENISGFFQVLQEWAEAEEKEGCESTPECHASYEKVDP
jgi:hypothetical protein